MAQIKDIRARKVPVGMLGGKNRFLMFDLNSYAELEALGSTISEVMEGLKKSDLKAVRRVLWAGLLHDECEYDEFTGDVTKYNITPREVGSWVTSDNMEQIMKALGDALSAANAAQVAEVMTTAIIKASGIESEVATVVMTEEEKAQAEEEERKNV